MDRPNICFIDLSYHEKTGSTRFIVDLLRERFNVSIFYDCSWVGGACPDFEAINSRNFEVIVFFQVDPRDHAAKLSCRNIVYFPMYDSFGLSNPGKEYDMRDVYFVNFSKTSHDSISKVHGRSIYAKYFPNPEPFAKYSSGGKGLFYWKRTDFLSWQLVKTIVGEQVEAIPIQCHTAIDPGYQQEKISQEDINRYQIGFSEWFSSKEQYWDMVASKRIFVAPRETEGIGFSFLEAMAMGKAVIANNRPTMNEYILHGVTGYLINSKKPQYVDLAKAEEVGKNAQALIRDGRKEWDRKKREILDLIDSMPHRAPSSFATIKREKILRRRSHAYRFKSLLRKVSRLPSRLSRLAKGRR